MLCAPVRKLADALADPQTAINGMLIDAPQPDGEALGAVGSPVHLSGGGFALRMTPPRVGAHGADILAELGYDPGEIAALRSGGVLA